MPHEFERKQKGGGRGEANGCLAGKRDADVAPAVQETTFGASGLRLHQKRHLKPAARAGASGANAQVPYSASERKVAWLQQQGTVWAGRRAVSEGLRGQSLTKT